MITTIKSVTAESSIKPTTPLSVDDSGPLTVSKPLTGVKFVLHSNCRAVSATTSPFTFALPAEIPHTAPRNALSRRLCAPLHPFNLTQIQQLLNETCLLQQYPSLLHSFETGFLLGVPLLQNTFTPENSNCLNNLYSEFVQIVNKEFELTRYIGPFSRTELLSLIGPFQTSPLSLVPKPNSNTFRLIQNLSYPHNNLPCPSINAYIDSANFPCTFGTFNTICFIINSLPPGSQVSTRDVADAYRIIPLHPSQWPGLVVRLDSHRFAINTQNSFGLASAGGVWGFVADFLADLFRAQGLGPISKWVDDFIFFRIPLKHLPLVNETRRQLQPLLTRQQVHSRVFYAGPPQADTTLSQYDEDYRYPLSQHSDSLYNYNSYDLDSLSQRIGLPWKSEKTTPFSHSATYLGFVWNLLDRQVSLHPSKQTKYLNAIQCWRERSVHTLLQVQSLYGKLLHTTYILPEGRLYLTGFERMLPTFHSNPNRPHHPDKSIADDLIWWHAQLSATHITCPIPSFAPYPLLQAFSDASNLAIGLVINGCWATFPYSPLFKQRNRDIAWAEAVAVELLLLALDYFPCTSKRFTIFCDNQVVSEGWHNGRSRNKFVNQVFRRIYTHNKQRGISLRIQYIPSEQNLADKPSRGLKFPGPHLPSISLPVDLQNDFYRELEPIPEHMHSRLCSIRSELLPETNPIDQFLVSNKYLN